MADIGIKIARPGKTTDSTDFRDYIALSSAESHKLLFKGKVTGGTYTHSLSKLPVYFVFEADNIDTPTYFTRTGDTGIPSTSNITSLPDPCYLVIFREGV